MVPTIGKFRLPTVAHKNGSASPERQWDLLRVLVSSDPDFRHKGLQHYCQKTALNEGTGAQGGYIVPIDYSTALLEARDEWAFLRPRATVVPMKSRTTQCPKITAETAQSAGTSPFFGGIKFKWGVGPNWAAPVVTETEPTFKQMTLTAWDLIGQVVASNQFVEDLTDEGEQALIRLFGRAAAWYEEYAYFNGLGPAQGQPLGILKAPCSILVARNTPAHIKMQDVSALSAKMIPLGWQNAIWVTSPSCLIDVTQITGYTPNMDVATVERGCVGFLIGRPVFVSEKLPPLGTQGDFILIDPSMYVIGDRQDVMIDASGHPLFRNSQTVFRVWLRSDGAPLFDNLITLADATSTASAFVILQ